MGEEERTPNFNDLIFLGFRSPQYTQVPDELFDLLMPRLSGAELKVLLYIVRRTFGFKKDTDRISLSQFETGITRKSGEALDGGTGLSRLAVSRALQSLVEKNILVKKRVASKQKGHESTEYALNIIGGGPSKQSLLAGPSKENGLALSKKFTSLVNEVYPQETVIQDTENNVNVGHIKNGDVGNRGQERLPSVEDLAGAMVLAQDILEVFGDRKSREFYTYASLKLLDYEHDVRFLLATIKQDVVRNPNTKVQNPAALFVAQLKKLATDRGVDL